MEKLNVLSLLGACLLMLPLSGIAAPPQGIYCSCGPSSSNGDSITSDLMGLDFVDGYFVRIDWAELEPKSNNYVWDFLDRQIDRVNSVN